MMEITARRIDVGKQGQSRTEIDGFAKIYDTCEINVCFCEGIVLIVTFSFDIMYDE